jgi:hypothetical protein
VGGEHVLELREALLAEAGEDGGAREVAPQAPGPERDAGRLGDGGDGGVGVVGIVAVGRDDELDPLAFDQVLDGRGEKLAGGVVVVVGRERERRVVDQQLEVRTRAGLLELGPAALVLVGAPERARQVDHPVAVGAEAEQRGPRAEHLVVGMRSEVQRRDHGAGG